MKPTREQADRFFEYMSVHQLRLGIVGWRIERSVKAASKGAMADVEFDDEARMATVRLGDFGPGEITDAVLCQTALHEALHILLRPLKSLAGSDKETTDEHIGGIEHGIINVLERLLSERE